MCSDGLLHQPRGRCRLGSSLCGSGRVRLFQFFLLGEHRAFIQDLLFKAELLFP